MSGANPIRTGDSNSGFIMSKFQKYKDCLMEKELREFLESIVSPNTVKGYLRAFGLWTEFSKKTIAETLSSIGQEADS